MSGDSELAQKKAVTVFFALDKTSLAQERAWPAGPGF